MPFRGYFLYTGSVLFVLLSILGWCLPTPDTGQVPSDVDHPAIRIHSTQKWPSAVVFDTTLPTILPPATTVAAPQPPAPEQFREAYALAEAAPEAKPADAVKPPKPHVRRTRVARAPPGSGVGNDMFGFRNDSFAPRRESFGFRNDYYVPRRWSSQW
jgi:hypothetical protein